MFGYVRPYIPELRVMEHQYYNAAYCGLCFATKRETGRLSSMFLSYDITFLVLVRLALSGEIPEFEKKRCALHPFKKRLVMKENDALRYSAHAAAILIWHKLDDDINDEKGLGSLRARLGRLVFKGAYRRAKKGFEELDAIVKNSLDELSAIEKRKERSADKPAAAFGSLMASICSFGETEEGKRRILSAVGDSVGRWIYLADAIDDMEDDMKKGSYNPFILLYDGEELDEDKKQDIQSAMTGLLGRAGCALELAELWGRSDLEGIITNIIFKGLPNISKKLIFGEEVKT